MTETKNSLLDRAKKHDIRCEEWREYRFPGDEIVRIEKPQFLIVSDNGHRVGAGEMSHYVPYGWIELKWKNVEGREANFICESEG